MNKISERKFESELVSESVYNVNKLGKHECHFVLYLNDGRTQGNVECDYGAMGSQNIGLFIRNGELVDYDGVYSIPNEAIEMIESAGIIVSDDFR